MATAAATEKMERKEQVTGVLTACRVPRHSVEHLFMCLLSKCISSLLKGPLRSFAHCVTGLFVVLLLKFENSLSILGVNPLLDM